MAAQETALIIFIRNPVPGKGKTRIARSVGVNKAYQVYLELLAETRRLAGTFSGPKFIYYSEFVDHEDLWDPRLYQKRVQAKGDLGKKMSAAFAEVLRNHPAAIIIGSDCPAMKHADLVEASGKLETHDAVIGPSEDGGYYLLGLCQMYQELFEGVPWSSARTLAKTVEKAARLGLEVARLRSLNDIDTWEDYIRWKGIG